MSADGTVAPPPGPAHDPGMEARVARLEEDVSEIRGTLRRLEPMIVRIDAVVPHLATKAEMASLRGEMRSEMESLRGEMRSEMQALRGELRVGLGDKPSKAYLWGILATLLAAYGCGLAALAILK